MTQLSLSHFRARMVPLLLLILAPLASAADAAPAAQYIRQLSDEDWQVRRQAAFDLAALQDDDRTTVAALISSLSDDDSRVRRAAADALGEIGPKASRSIPALLNLFDDIDPSVIESAARATGLMGSRASRANDELTMLLQHSDARIRGAAAVSIGQLGRRARSSMPELSQNLGDADPAVRAAAAHSLGAMGTSASKYSSRLVRLLDDGEPEVRNAASRALGRIGRGAVEVLIRTLQNGDPVFLQSVVDTLGLIGPSATPQLIESVQSKDEQTLVRQYATLALAKIGPDDRRVVPALIAALGDNKADIRRAAAEAIGNVGPSAANASDRLINLASNHREEVLVREFSIAALARIAPQDEAVNAALVNAVADGDPRIYKAAVAALVAVRSTTIGDNDVPALIRQLQSEVPGTRITAAQQLGECGPYAASAVPALIESLAGNQNPVELRIAATRSLGLIGPDAESAVPELARALEDNNQRLSNAALVSLGRIGPQTRTIPALLQSMRSGDLATRAAAASKLQSFAQARIETWQPLLLQSDAPILRNWLARHANLYGIDPIDADFEFNDRNDDAADYFDVFGGRAAIRESMQLELIDEPRAGNDDRHTIPVSSLSRVNVNSHPFEKMLEDSDLPIRTISLAQFSPPDHFFAYFRDVAALRNVFSHGTEQFLRFESAITIKSIEYNIEQQYLDRLGLGSGILDRLEAIGGIGDIAIVTPDLFFIDGTDITTVATLTAPQLTETVLQLLGLDNPGTEIATYTLPNGEPVYWAIQDNVLIISSNSDELAGALAARERDGRNSLGRTDEFLYMLQQMDIEEPTEMFVYLSDAFIRHLVSPEIKIAQLRRMQARAEMEMLASGALLYLLDGHKKVPGKQELIARGYAPGYFEDRDYTISEDLIVESELFGSIATPKPLSANPVTFVSDRESDAYEKFVDNYSRYWRQFFDPIAIRLDRVDDQTRELNTFILPLPDSRLYEQVEDALTTADTGRRLSVPVLSPNPSMTFSLNVSDDLRVRLSRELARTLVQYTSVDPNIFDSIGSGIHLAVQDSTPIVALGSGDVWGALDKDMVRMQGFESFLPFLLSLMTQPTTVLVELADSDQVRDFLNDAVVRRLKGGGEGEFHRLQDKEAWIYSLNVADMFQLHLRVEIKRGYLLISNLPWSTQLDISDVVEMDLNGAQLQLNLNEITQQLPALHTKVFTDYRAAAVDGMGYLYPLLVTGISDSVPQAIERHYEVFGFRPAHPNKGQWIWRDSFIESSEFGTALQPVQPEYVTGQKDFGVFPTLGMISVNMQLEDTGLRARVRWQVLDDQ